VAVDDNYVYIAGFTTEYAPIANVWKLNKETGELQWTYNIGAGPAYGIAVDGDGNVYVVGVSSSAATPSEYAVVWKLSSSGQLIWARDLPSCTAEEPVPGIGGGIIAANGIVLDAQGNIYIAGTNWHTEDKTVWKLNNDGEFLWSYATGPYGEPPAKTTAIRLDEAGHIYIGGINDFYNKNVRKLKQSDASLVWSIDTIDGVTSIAVGNMKVQFDESSKQVIFCEPCQKVQMTQECYIGKGVGEGSQYACKLDCETGGIILWYSFNENTYKDIYAIIVDNDDNIYAGGHHGGGPGEYYCISASLWKVSPNGTILWTFDAGLGSDSDDVMGIVLDKEKNVYVVGPTIWEKWKSNCSYEVGNIVPITTESGSPCYLYQCGYAHISTPDDCPITGPHWSWYWYLWSG
jgi:hypothetical protein